MQIFKKLLPLFLFADILCAQVKIGEETIRPIEFPKFTLAGEYSFGRRGRFLGEEGIVKDVKAAFGGSLTFDVGLAKYFNAGAGMSATVGNPMKNESIFARFFLFGKPIIPIGDHFSIFSRVSAGLSLMLISPLAYFADEDDPDFKAEVERIYGRQQYTLASPGVIGGATIGLEYFPWSRFGLAVEWGVRADLIYLRKSDLIEKLTKLDLSKADAPNSIKYLGLDWPLSVSLHIIL